MYLHIGNGQTVKKKEIIGIFDMDTATVSSVSRQFLSSAEQKKEIWYGDSDIPKSFIVCTDGPEKQKIVFSRISASSLKLRIAQFFSE
jgi:hypothetical protein